MFAFDGTRFKEFFMKAIGNLELLPGKGTVRGEDRREEGMKR